MNILAIVCQVFIALGIVNVWLLRHGQPSRWRPEGANNMVEEFRRYGLPDWVRLLVGAAKLTLAGLLLVGLAYPVLAVAAGAGIALLMAAAVFAHLRVGDPLIKSLPAFSLLLLSLLVVWARLA